MLGGRGFAGPTEESGNEPGDEGRPPRIRGAGESGDLVCILRDHSGYAMEKRLEGPA